MKMHLVRLQFLCELIKVIKDWKKKRHGYYPRRLKWEPMQNFKWHRLHNCFSDWFARFYSIAICWHAVNGKLSYLSDMRKALSRDIDKLSVIPLKNPVRPEELEWPWLWWTVAFLIALSGVVFGALLRALIGQQYLEKNQFQPFRVRN